MQQTLKTFTISPEKLEADLVTIKANREFPHYECILKNESTVQDVEKIAKTLCMQTVFIFKRPGKIHCYLTW